MITRNEYKGDLALGKRMKTTVVSALDTATESAGLIADGVTTGRLFIENLHDTVYGMNIEIKIENASKIHKGIRELVSDGMTEEQACHYLQVPYTIKPTLTITA